MNAPSLITLNGHVLGAMDTETTGRDPFRNEVCQIAIAVLDCHLNVVTHFQSKIRPQFPERMHPQAVATHGLTVESLSTEPDIHEVTDHLWDWFEGLNLPPGKRIVPLCHNCQFDIPFVQEMLGHEMFNEIFGYPTRDTQSLASGINDAAAFKNLALPFDRVGLGWLCEHFGIDLDNAHDALADALATARLYRALLNFLN